MSDIADIELDVDAHLWSKLNYLVFVIYKLYFLCCDFDKTQVE
jgi:hypothetical protein